MAIYEISVVVLTVKICITPQTSTLVRLTAFSYNNFISKSTDAEWIKFIHTLKYYYEISIVVLTDKVKAGILERELWIDAG